MNSQLYNIDCVAKMQQFINNNRKFDLILTDPPYEMDIHGGTANNDFSSRKLISEKHIQFITDGFDYQKCFNMFLQLQTVTNILIFCSNNQISKTMKFFEDKGLSATLLVWKKLNPIPLCNGKHISDLQFIVYVRGKGAFFNNDEEYGIKMKCKQYSSPSSKYRIHPTQKPIKLLQQLIRLHSKKGDVIFDPFMGSGSTGVASLNLSRCFCGCELKEQFFAGAKNRIDNLLVQNVLF